MKPINTIQKTLFLGFGHGTASTATNEPSQTVNITVKPYKVEFFREWVNEDGTHEENDYGYTAQCLDLQGCLSEGDTLEQAEANIIEAIGAYVDVLRQESRLKEMRCMDCGVLVAILDKEQPENKSIFWRKFRCEKCYSVYLVRRRRR